MVDSAMSTPVERSRNDPASASSSTAATPQRLVADFLPPSCLATEHRPLEVPLGTLKAVAEEQRLSLSVYVFGPLQTPSLREHVKWFRETAAGDQLSPSGVGGPQLLTFGSRSPVHAPRMMGLERRL